jgi:hypothetical protein
MVSAMIIIQFRVIVDMPSLSMIVFSSLLILTLESSTIKESILPFLVKKQLTILLLILMSKLIILATKVMIMMGTSVCRYLSVAVESSKKSPELIQLLDMHTHFSAGTPGARVISLLY